MRKLLLTLGILVGIVVIAVGIFAATFNINSYHDRIQSELETQLGRQVTLGEMHLGFFPPRFRVENLAIADDPAFNSQRPFVQTQELDVSVALLPLLHKDVEIDSINLVQPRAELIKNKQGVWNFASLGKKSASTEPSSSKPFSLGELVIKDGQVALTDQKQPTRSVYDHIDLTLHDFAPKRPFTVELAAHLPGTGAQEIQLQGKGGPIPDNPAGTPFDGTVTLKQVTIAGFQQFLNNPALVNTDGILSGETKISTQGGKLTASGHTTADSVKVHGIDLGYPIVADYDVTDDLNSDLLTLRSTTVKLGSTPLSVNGTVNSGATPMKLDVNINAGNVSIADAMKLAAAAGVAAAPGIAVTGTVNADVHATGTPDALALNGSVNVRDVQASGSQLARPVAVKAINLTLTPTDIHSDNFNVTSGGTSVAVQFALHQYMSKVPSVDASVKAPSAGLPEVLSMAKAYGVTALNNVTGEGTLAMDLRASGPVAAANSNAILRAVNGTISLAFNNVKYTGTDANSQLSKIAGFLKPSSSGQSNVTNISKVTGNIVIKNGIAQTSNLQALLDIGNLGVTGTANLVDQSLNMRANAVMSKESSQQAGGSSVGGFMQTALANNNGELVIPILITGTFQQPRFAPDVQQMAQMKLKGLVPSFNNPQAGVSSLLGGFLGQKSQGAAGQSQQQNQQQASPVQQLMGIFGKKQR